MRIMLFAATALAAAGLAGPAFAQDSRPGFTGAHAEGVVGWDRVQDGSDSTDGLVYGVAAGYDYQVGKLVLGIEAEATTSTTSQTVGNLVTPGDSLRIKMGRDLYAGARVGIALSPRAMVYAKGGYTNVSIDTRYTSGATTAKDSDDAPGWRAGVGAEFRLSGHVFVKGEYRYAHYNEVYGNRIDRDRHQLIGGIGFRF